MTRNEALDALRGAAVLGDAAEQKAAYGSWGKVKLSAEGVTTLPGWGESHAARRLRKAFEVLGYCAEPFDWQEWKQDADVTSEAWIAAASREEIARLLLALERAERFCEGTMAQAFASGTYQRIATRILELEDLRPNSS